MAFSFKARIDKSIEQIRFIHWYAINLNGRVYWSKYFIVHRGCNKTSSPRVSLFSFSRYLLTGRDEGQVLNMAVRGVLRSVWTSFTGFKSVAGGNTNVLQRLNAPNPSLLASQSRGIRQGETFL